MLCNSYHIQVSALENKLFSFGFGTLLSVKKKKKIVASTDSEVFVFVFFFLPSNVPLKTKLQLVSNFSFF